jgi:signal peptide peptidase SppA
MRDLLTGIVEHATVLPIWCVDPIEGLGRVQAYRRWALGMAAQSAIDFEPPNLAAAVDLIPGRGGKQVARIPVRGLMMKGASYYGTSTVQIRQEIRKAAADPNVSGILLDIYSGGGSSLGQADLIGDVRRAARQKPIWSQIEDWGASAAYYLAAATDAVYANNNDARIGSIGTMLAVDDLSKMADQLGIKVELFTTGPLKAAGFPGTSLTDEHRADFQSWVDGIQAGFDATVKNGRHMSAAELAAVRTGGMFFAQDAKQKKLIDGVRPLESTLAALSAAG